MEDKKLTLAEAFQSLKTLTEDVFEVDDEGITKANSFMDDFEDEQEIVIDPLAETEEDLQNSYLGKVILDCVICQSKIYKDLEEVIISEDGSLANEGDICPYCQSSDGFKVVGQVAAFNPNEEDSDSIQASAEVSSEDMLGSSKVEEPITTKIRKNKFRPKAPIKESIENLTIETENETINVSSESKDSQSDEIISPVTPDVESQFNKENEDDYEDVDIDEFEESDFDMLGEKYLKRVYENVRRFKTTKGAIDGNRLKLEGIITFKSGKKAQTSFIFESKQITKKGKLKLEGFNKQFAKGSKAFTLVGSLKGNKFLSESLTYNYTTKDAKSGKSTKLYGRVVR